MKNRWSAGLGLALVSIMGCRLACGQASATALQRADVSVFAAGTGTFTGLEGGHNLALTAGVDLSIKSLYGFRPAIELRGTYPVDSGAVDGQKDVLIGARVMKTVYRFSPYVDAFFGRGALSYPGGIIVFFPNSSGGFRYDRTSTNIYAGGGGVDVRITPHFDLKGDVQVERWGTPVVTSHRIYSKPVSIGLVYHFDLNEPSRRHKRVKERRGTQAVTGQPMVAPQ